MFTSNNYILKLAHDIINSLFTELVIKLTIGRSKVSQILYLAGYALKARLFAAQRKPLLASFKVTYRCNLKCSHCPFWNKPSPAYMDIKEAEALLQKLYRQGVRLVIFEGGEPLLYPHLDKLVEKAKTLFFSVGITTNGILDLDRANPDLYFVSLDGPRQIHDQIRGTCFDHIMDNIAAHPHMKIIANITISSINYRYIEQLVRFLKGKIFGVTVQFIYPFPGIKTLPLDYSDRTKVLDKLIRLKKEGYPVLDSFSCLESLKDNRWKCHDFLIANTEPDQTLHYGCYLKHRLSSYNCSLCGYAVHCEASAAYDFNPGALGAAKSIFWD